VTAFRRLLVGLFAFALAGWALPARALADAPQFGTPRAATTLGQPLTFDTSINSGDISFVDVLVRLAGHKPTIVLPAQLAAGINNWEASADVDVPTSVECACFAAGQSAPNTRLEYQFRVTSSDGTQTLGPLGQTTVTDDRFNWQTLSQDMVVVHWYEGDQAFAKSAADVANAAINKASQLLGVTLPDPVDLFVYATQDALLQAVSPNRENIAGEAHATIGTMFVWLPPSQPTTDKAVTVAHELTHLVFNQATENPYHLPPRWLNEGIAVYLSEGYSGQWQSVVANAVAAQSLIPLDGLAGLFPSPTQQFYLAYGEAVASVDYFIRTYGDQKLWDLVRSYSQGLSDDDAFTQATGGNVAAFNAAWMGSLGVPVAQPVGPQPGAPGPVPSAWLGEMPSFTPATPGPVQSRLPSSPFTGSPGASPGSSRGPTSGKTFTPDQPPPTQPTGGTSVVVIIGALLILLAIVIVLVLVISSVRSGRSSRPPYP
jgi:hypothetical protein